MSTAVADSARWLREHARGEVRVDLAGRVAYAVNASAYRVVPGAVLVAADEQDVHLALTACRAEGVGLTMRGAGSGMAGQALGEGLVVDCTRLARVLALDPDQRLARVQPGVVQAELDRLAARHGLCLGPDTASAARATLGGMVANDSAGMRSVIYGRTSHRVRRLRVLRADGTEEWLGETPRAQVRGPWRAVLDAHDRRREQIAARWPRLLRCVDGYNLPALGGEAPQLARLLCGSEGTLAITLEVELQLDPLPPRRSWTVVAPGSLREAVNVSHHAVATGASAVELLDAPTLASDPVARDLAAGATTVLLVEHSGDRDSIQAVREAFAAGLELGAGALRFVDDPAQARALIAMRRNLLALTSRPVGDRRPVSVGEDGAVPPERLAEYVEGLRSIFAAEGTESAVTGHISVGCIHTLPLLDLRQPGDRASLRRIAQGAAELSISLGGAISGEHGDGISRSELLPRLFGAELCAAFGEIKCALDPQALLNAGKIVDPWPLDRRLRTPAPIGDQLRSDADRCIGIGACRDRLAGTMCPPFRALAVEESSTRGMANLLREALDGTIAHEDPLLGEALGLCIGCKGCQTDCPAGVDLAWLKARHQHEHPPTAMRPRLQAGVLASTPSLLRLAGRAPRLANGLAASPGHRLVARLLGLHPDRPAPRLAARSLRALTRDRPQPAAPDVALFVDTFTDLTDPSIGLAALAYLEAAGARVALAPNVCCGRTQISGGRLDTARRLARENVRRLAPLARAGVPIAGLEPSCILTFRDEVPRLLASDPDAADARLLAEHAALVEELVGRWSPPRLSPAPSPYVVHPHCHARAAGAGLAAQTALELIPSASVQTLDAGCCGMAGSFGYRAERYELSVAIARDRLLPALASRAEAVVVAQGTSCRAQIRDLAGIEAIHPIQALAQRMVAG